MSPYGQENNTTNNLNNDTNPSDKQIVTSMFSQSQSEDMYSANQDKKTFDYESKQVALSIKSLELERSWLASKIIFSNKLLNNLNLDETKIEHETKMLLKQKESEYQRQEAEFNKILKAYEDEVSSEQDWAIKKQSEISEMMDSMIVT